jgi:hypothetical protein
VSTSNETDDMIAGAIIRSIITFTTIWSVNQLCGRTVIEWTLPNWIAVFVLPAFFRQLVRASGGNK